MSTDGEIPSPELMRQIKDVIKRVLGMRGNGVTNLPNTPIVINPSFPPPPRMMIAHTEWLVRTTGAYSGGYPWEQIKPASGGGYSAVTNGRTSTSGGKPATHIRGITSLPTGTVGILRLYYNDAAQPEPVFLFSSQQDVFPAIITASSGTAPGATYTAKWVDASGGYGGFTAQSDSPGLTCYNAWEDVDRVSAGTLTLDPDGDSTDEGTIQKIPNDEIVFLHWVPTSGGAGQWWFDKPCDILTDCDA